MTAQAWILLLAFLCLLLALAWPLGTWLVHVADGRFPGWMRPLAAAERGVYRLAGVDPSAGMSWRQYAVALLVFNIPGTFHMNGCPAFPFGQVWQAVTQSPVAGFQQRYVAHDCCASRGQPAG